MIPELCVKKAKMVNLFQRNIFINANLNDFFIIALKNLRIIVLEYPVSARFFFQYGNVTMKCSACAYNTQGRSLRLEEVTGVGIYKGGPGIAAGSTARGFEPKWGNITTSVQSLNQEPRSCSQLFA
jgi:hypothetical protein